MMISSSMQVSTNGLISFESIFNNDYLVEDFSASFTSFHDTIVAPYWKDLNPEVAGSVFARTTMDAHLMNQTARLIADSNSEFSSFQPTLAVIATWERVALHHDQTMQVYTN